MFPNLPAKPFLEPVSGLPHDTVMHGLIAIQPPNVGKSALFNRIAGRRIAIVHDEPGVTRDRISAEAESTGQPVHARGHRWHWIAPGAKNPTTLIIRAALDQVELAIEAASVIILVVNVQEGVVPLDKEVAQRLRKSGKPVLVAANKVDTYRSEDATTSSANWASKKSSRSARFMATGFNH